MIYSARIYCGEIRRRLMTAVFCPGFQKGRVPSEKGTLAR